MKNYLIFIALLLLLTACNKKEPQKSPVLIDTLYNKAWDFNDKDLFDSSFRYFNLAKEAAINRKDSIKVAKCLINMAIISVDHGDLFGSIEISLSAIPYLNPKRKKDRELLSSDYNNIGKSSHLLKKYDEATDFYLKALDHTTNDTVKAIYLNNLANNYHYLGQYDKSIAVYQKLLPMKVLIANQAEYARYLSNYERTKWYRNSKYNPVPKFLEALETRIKENDLLGQNASYVHLADYYAKKLPDSALYYAKKMLNVSSAAKSPEDQLAALQKLTTLSHPSDTKRYFERYQKLNDSIQTSRNAAKNQFALVRYETEKHKAASIKKESDILKRNIALSVLVLILISGYFWYRKRKKTLQQEKELEVKNTEIKYVKKVHDHVANRIYQVMDEIDNRPEMEKEEVADKLEVIYHITRDLSYETSTKYKNDFAKSLSKMFSSYQSAKVSITVDGNEEKLWADIQENVKSEVFAILQELMTNMSKHSQASEVNLQLEKNSQSVRIIYNDNGVGIPKDAQFGNGLKNTETRIQGISGSITFENINNNGLQINITFPVA